MPSFQIQDSVAFVTGTNKQNGIGRAIVTALIQQGAKKVYATARNKEQLQDLVAQFPDKVVAVALDVTDFAAVEQLSQQYPDVNLVVNNAGYFGQITSLDDSALQVARTEIEINYFAPLAIVKSFATQLQSSPNSAIVNINSIASLVNFPGASTYSASKAAGHSLTQAQRRELPSVLVMGVYPGPIDTDMTETMTIDKASPILVADAVVAALASGVEDVYPDATAKQMYEGWMADAKAMEKSMAQQSATAAWTLQLVNKVRLS